mmetsp:Transcript_100228/g.161574  ORF Transcript_100228/g.161574 Transcript_100228/m.161574 type:complete len:238 (-) Transcript_100228:38-751(-)
MCNMTYPLTCCIIQICFCATPIHPIDLFTGANLLLLPNGTALLMVVSTHEFAACASEDYIAPLLQDVYSDTVRKFIEMHQDSISNMQKKHILEFNQQFLAHNSENTRHTSCGNLQVAGKFPNISAQDPHNSAHQPYISAKEPNHHQPPETNFINMSHINTTFAASFTDGISPRQGSLHTFNIRPARPGCKFRFDLPVGTPEGHGYGNTHVTKLGDIVFTTHDMDHMVHRRLFRPTHV